MVINPYIFKREPNTFIGGIAKLGGTGANAPILAAAQLASKMGISESIIKGFKVVGEDVECRITSDYNLKQYAFGSMDGLSSNNNIIYFNDPDGRMKIGGRNAFSHCQNLESLIVTGVTEIGESFCNFNPKLETLIVTSLITAVNQPFDHNVKLKEFTALNLNNFTGASNFFFGNTDLHTVNTPEINRLGDNHYRECVSLTQIINDNALTAGFHIFRDCSSIELISIKKIKSMGSNAFTNIKTNCVINCNIFLRTSNMGDIDANLLYAYTSRNATINFYDDNGNFVETYNPNNDLYIAFKNRVIADSGIFEENPITFNSEKLLLTPNAYKANKIYSALPNLAASDFAFSRNSEAKYFDKDGILQTASANVPRIDHSSGQPIILIEPEATNLCLNSVDLTDSYWSKGSQDVITAGFESPDGLNTAFRFEKVAVTKFSFFRFQLSEISGRICSWYVKNINAVNVYFRGDGQLSDGKIVFYSFNFANETVSDIRLKFEKLPNNWYRFYYDAPFKEFGTENPFMQIGVGINEDNQPINQQIIIWNPQLETGSNPTSPIFTNGSTATRLADVATVNVPSGVVEIEEIFGDDTNNVVTTIPSTYQIPNGKIKKIMMI